MTRNITHKIPTNSLEIINDNTFTENADKRAHVKLPDIAMSRTRRRPVVSAKNPQKCELRTMPA